MVLAVSVLLSWVVGVASQANQGAILDPSSVAASTAGTGYGNTGTQTSYANQDVGNSYANQAPPAPAIAGAPSTFNPMAAMAPAPPAAQTGIADAINAGMNGDVNALKAAAPEAIAEVPTASGMFVDGFIEGWFEKVVLETGEKTCIRVNVKKMTTDGVGLLSELATVIVAVVGKETPNMFAVMGGAAQVVELVTTTQALIKNCVKQDAVGVMTVTMNHLKDPAYVKGRLLANGLEITQTLAAAIGQAQQEQWTQVGKDFGIVLRKALLSDDSQPIQLVLPTGMTEQEVGPLVMQGIIEGIFVEGTAVKIRSSKDPSIQIFIDLHRCVAKEAKYVSTAMDSIYLAITQLTIQIDKMNLAAKGIKTGYGANGQTPMAPGVDTEWMKGMTGLMSNIPVLMDRCGITPSQKGDMKRAFKDMQDLKAAFTIPGPGDKAAAGTQAAQRMQQATVYWQQGAYNNFGIMTGGMLRDLLLTMFPSKVGNAAGQPPGTALAARMGAPNQQGYSAHPGYGGHPRLYETSWEKAHLDDANTSAGSLAFYVGGFAAVTLLGLAILRVKSQSQSEHHPALLQSEPEANDVEAIE